MLRARAEKPEVNVEVAVPGWPEAERLRFSLFCSDILYVSDHGVELCLRGNHPCSFMHKSLLECALTVPQEADPKFACHAPRLVHRILRPTSVIQTHPLHGRWIGAAHADP